MKKSIFIIGILFLILTIFLIGDYARAQAPVKVEKCAKLAKDVEKISSGKGKVNVNNCVKVGNSGVSAGNDFTCTANEPCVFYKECTIGATSTIVCSAPNKEGNPDESVDIAFENWGIVAFLSTIQRVTDWFFYFLLIVSVLMIVAGGFFFLTAAGDPAKTGRGKWMLVFSAVGIAIAAISKLIPSLVRSVMGL